MKVNLLFLNFFPEFFNWVIIRRIGRQIVNSNAISLFGEEFLHGLAGVISGPILDKDDVFSGLGEHFGQEGLIRFRIKTAFIMSFTEKATRKVVDQTENLIPEPANKCCRCSTKGIC